MANQYIYQLTDSWTDAGTTYNAIKMDVADGGSAAASNLLDLRVEDVAKFSVRKSGAVILTGAVTGATNVTASGTVTADLLTVTKTNANASAITSTGYSLTGTSATPLVDLAGTWDTTGNPTAINLNVTNTASGGSSELLRLQTTVSAVTTNQFRFLATGQIVGVSAAIRLNNIGLATCATINAANSTGDGAVWAKFFAAGLTIRNDAYFGWANLAGGVDASFNTSIYRDADNIVAQRNGTNAQTFRVYKTFTDASNYERGKLEWSGNVLRIGTEKAGTGTARAMEFHVDSALRASFGINSNIAIGNGATATGLYSHAIGRAANASQQDAAVMGGFNNAASGTYSVIVGGANSTSTATASTVVGGGNNTASASYALASGYYCLANKYGQSGHAGGFFAAQGDAQRSTMVLRNATTDATATELFLDGSSARATIPNNTCWHADIRIVGRQATGTHHATYHRKCTIYKNTTAASTTLVGTVQTIGTDEESNANWAVAVTADTTNGSLKIEVTGVAATNIRWVAELSVVEVAYA